jgi:hypothetical protein
MSSINNLKDHGINRGVELILRRRVKEKKKNSGQKKFEFYKVFSFFKKEFHLRLELYLKEKN